MPNQFVVAGPPSYLTLPTFLHRYFPILEYGLRAQKQVKAWPDCGPHSGHVGSSPAATIDPDIFDPDKVLHLAHQGLHLGLSHPALVDVSDKFRTNLLEGRNVFLRRTYQP